MLLRWWRAVMPPTKLERDLAIQCVLSAFATGSFLTGTAVFFTNFGTAYTTRIVDVPASTGYGDPVQKLFKLKDGEKIVAAFSLDPRVAKKIEAKKEGDAPPIHAIGR